MSRDWNAEEAKLRARAAEAFEVLMGVRRAVTSATSSKAETYARYVAEEALEAYQKARDAIAAFEDEGRRQCPH